MLGMRGKKTGVARAVGPSTKGSSPLISVVIPTRDRPDTLRSCLAALAHHKSNRIEIVVQDNFSAAETQKVVLAAQKKDPRINYVRAPFATSQRHNFELGLAAATGEYMTIIGDDDGFCLGSLDWLVEHLSIHSADAVRWNLVHYAWPSLSTDGEGFVRIYTSHYYGGWRNGTAEHIAQATISAKNIGSWDNILIYHGMISRKLYDRVRAKSGGVFFPYLMPDIYAHNLIAFHCEKLLQVDNPVSIYGTSGHSAGVSWSRSMENKKSESEAGQKWIKETDVDPLSKNSNWLPNIRTLRYHDLRALELAQSYGLLPKETVIDRNAFTDAILEEIKKQPWTLSPWLTTKPLSAEDKQLFKTVKKHFSGTAKKIPPAPSAKYAPDYPDTLLRVRFDSRGLTDDVEGAMLALHNLMSDPEPVYDAVASDHPILTTRQAGPSVFLERIIRILPLRLLNFAQRILPKKLLSRYDVSADESSVSRRKQLANRLMKLREFDKPNLAKVND
jgi:Glycosyl transferase family 2